METMEIIKEAFLFPSQNLEKLAIYIVLTFVVGILFVGSAVTTVLGINYGSIYLILTAILFILGIVVALIITGYQIDVLKSGIDHDEFAPAFDWKNNLITGIMMLVVSIVYFIIPLIVFMVMALITNIPGQFANIAQQVATSPANVTAVSTSASPVLQGVSKAAIASLGTSIAITAIVAAIVFIIFAFLHNMGQARLANTGDLGHALNIPEAFRDITRIGAGKVIAVILLIVVIMAVIQGILGYIYGQIPQISILSVVVTPYLAFFSQRAIGLLYSDIA